MKIRVELNNASRAPVGKDFLSRVISRTVISAFGEKKESITVSVAFIVEEEMRHLNKKFRKHDRPTDVLSFAEYRTKSAVENDKEKNIFLGELLICYNDIERYAKKEAINIKEELANVIAHGTLHLLGYRHGKGMFAIQESVKKAIKNKKNGKAQKI